MQPNPREDARNPRSPKNADVQAGSSNLGRPIVRSSNIACQRCRAHKLKCNKQYPSCSRCTRRLVVCDYPVPQDRKQIAARRRAARLCPSEATNLLEDTHNNFPPSIRDNSSISTGTTSEASRAPIENLAPNRLRLDDTLSLPASCDTDLPSRAIGFMLLEVYFERIYNANILFNKTKFFHSYMNDELPDYLLRAVLALATLFLHSDIPSQPCYKELSRLSCLDSFDAIGSRWAHASSTEALSLACQPSLSTAQTFECLTIYWFAIEDAKRADIHSALAYRSCCMLGYNKAIMVAGDKSSIGMDIERRCFWACWASMCIAGEPKAYLRSAWLEVSGLPLPAGTSNNGSISNPGIAEKMDQDWHCSVVEETVMDLQRPKCLFAELMKVLGVWAKVQTWIRNPISDLTITELETLSSLLTQLHDAGTFPRLRDMYQKNSNDDVLVVFIHSVYHLSVMAMNIAILPGSSRSSTSTQELPDVLKGSVETAMAHARHVGMLLKQYTNHDCDPTKLAPFVGYVVYVATCILVAFSKASTSYNHPQDTRLSRLDGDLVVSMMHIIDCLAAFWKPLSKLSLKLHNMLHCILPQLATSSISPSPTDLDSQVMAPLGPSGSASTINDTSFIRTGYVFAEDSIPHGTTSSHDNANRGASEISLAQLPGSSIMFSTQSSIERSDSALGHTFQSSAQTENYSEITPSDIISYQDLEILESLMFMDPPNYHFY